MAEEARSAFFLRNRQCLLTPHSRGSSSRTTCAQEARGAVKGNGKGREGEGMPDALAGDDDPARAGPARAPASKPLAAAAA